MGGGQTRLAADGRDSGCPRFFLDIRPLSAIFRAKLVVQRKVYTVNKTYLRFAAIALVTATLALGVAGCKCPKSDTGKSEHPAGSEHPTKSEHPEHPE